MLFGENLTCHRVSRLVACTGYGLAALAPLVRQLVTRREHEQRLFLLSVEVVARGIPSIRSDKKAQIG